MAFAPKLGCPMCSIVSAASHATPNSPRSPSFPPGSTQPEVLWRDDNFTAYKEKANPVSSQGHIIVAFNLHVPSIYTLSSTDLPLLVNVRNLATRLLASFLTPSSPPTPSVLPPVPKDSNQQFRIGFITPPFKDNKIPITDHLHAHAFIGPPDLMGWWRGIAYGPLAWYSIEDLIAEIRESVSNNRVKSGYENRQRAPIDMVPQAGARAGTADGIETTEPGLANLNDLEDGQRTPVTLGPRSPNSLSPQSQIPHLRV
ncbi:uncharacterized protein LACBIDRAFT_301741 [Laccaria bicolor S238N-H82]|uniref:Predicted protein n=1 Tax=Laccaria bicolor (strain S238N-H82 / ATCC MYA-4686) TaxID=486041 RepID=B0CP62_LACBS|nr:uncharacterized protein LACBIDRAFT_301741 [Laccaria bicolor S238N-H82]EDR16047.1 predicted protein [Laccaria bicolor S238N-H82]|eukprot:XP_001874255.1 predicted protein [Laccaria bicolor S238N-H82]